MVNPDNVTPEYQAGAAAHKRGVPYATQPYGLDQGKNSLWHKGWQSSEAATKQLFGVVTSLEKPTLAVHSGSDATAVVSGSSQLGVVSSGSASVPVSSSSIVGSGGSVVLPASEGHSSSGTIPREHVSSGASAVSSGSGQFELAISSGGSAVVSGGSGIVLSGASSGSGVAPSTSQVISGGLTSGTSLNSSNVTAAPYVEAIKRGLSFYVPPGMVQKIATDIMIELTKAGYTFTPITKA